MQQADDPPEQTTIPYSNGKRMEDFLRQFDTRIVEASHNGGLVNILDTEAHQLDTQLRDDILENPEGTIRDLEETLERIWKFPGRFALTEVVDKVHIHEIRPRHLFTYVAIPCVVQMVNAVKSFPVESAWLCGRCGCWHHRRNTKNNQIILEVPRECPHCNRKGNQTAFQHINEESSYEAIQIIAIQEPPDGMRSANLPATLECLMRPHLCGEVKVGEKIVLNGILKAVLIGNGKKSGIMEHRLEVYSIERSEAEMDEDLTDEDVEEIKRLALEPDIIDKLARSLAPDAYGMEKVSMGLILQMFGAPPIGSGIKRKRGEIHMLLLGDPAVYKSGLCRQVMSLHPRGMMASGGSSSAVGLVAAVVRSPDGTTTIEAGPMVLADGGMVFVDELSHLSEEESGKLNEVMEHGTFSLNKAGAHMTLNARVSVLSAANPRGDRFDDDTPILNQAEIVRKATLSRFDVIFLIRDGGDDEPMIADNMLDEYMEGAAERMARAREIEESMIRKYVAYAREHVHPVLTPEAKALILERYFEERERYLRPVGNENPRLAVDKRKIRSLSKLALAAARARLSSTTSLEDAALACRVMFEFALNEMFDQARTAVAGQATLDTAPRVKMSVPYDLEREAYKVCCELSKKAPDSIFSENEFLGATIDDKRFKQAKDLKKLLRVLYQKGRIGSMGQDKYRVN